MVDWASKKFDTRPVWTRKVILIVLIYPGLARKDGPNIVLTEIGAKFLETKNSDLILQTYLDRVWGMREILLWLREEQLTLNQIFEKCVQLKVKWTKQAQVDFRLRWLRALGCIERRGTLYALTPKGDRKAEDLVKQGLAPEPLAAPKPAPPQRTPLETTLPEGALSHNDIQSVLLKLGELKKYRAEKEYPINRERLDAVWMGRAREKPDISFEIQVGGICIARW